MNKYIQTFFTFFGVWFIASLLNGLLSGICIAVFSSSKDGIGTVGLAMIMSFIFSAPLVGVVWLVTTIAQANGSKGHSLFQTILGTALVCSAIGAVFFICTIGTEFKEARFAVGLCIIIAALSAVLFFRNQLKGYE